MTNFLDPRAVTIPSEHVVCAWGLLPFSGPCEAQLSGSVNSDNCETLARSGRYLHVSLQWLCMLCNSALLV